MGARDLLGRIAQARAALLVGRPGAALLLEIGPYTWRDLRVETGAESPQALNELLETIGIQHVLARPDREGYMLRYM